MALEMGRVDPKLFAIIGVALVGVIGWQGYGKLSAAKNELNTAKTENSTAQTELDSAKSNLESLKAQGASEDPDTKADRKALAEIQVSKTAIPRGKNNTAALQQIEALARTSGITIIDDSIKEEVGTGVEETVTEGSQPFSITVVGHATYSSLHVFERRIQDTATIYRKQLYVNGRLLSIKSLKIETGAGDSGGSSGGSLNSFTGEGSSEGADGEVVIPKGHVKFTMVIEFYADMTGAAGVSPTVGGTDGTTGSGADPNATGGDPNAAPATGADPAASGGAPVATDPSATPAADPSTTAPGVS